MALDTYSDFYVETYDDDPRRVVIDYSPGEQAFEELYEAAWDLIVKPTTYKPHNEGAMQYMAEPLTQERPDLLHKLLSEASRSTRLEILRVVAEYYSDNEEAAKRAAFEFGRSY